MKNVILFLLLVFNSFVYGQNAFKLDGTILHQDSVVIEGTINKRYYNEGKLDVYKGQEAFDYAEVESGKSVIQKYWDLLVRYVKNSFNKGVNGKAFQYFLIAFAIIGLVWFLMKKESINILSRKNTSLKKYVEELDIRVDEDILLTKLKEFEKNKEYKEAVRYTYLLLLKTLDEKDIIQWKEWKLSTDYELELTNGVFSNGFLEMTRYFNFGWYGNRNISDEMYSEVRNTYTELKGKIERGS